MAKWKKIAIVVLFLACLIAGTVKGLQYNVAVKKANSKAFLSFQAMNKKKMDEYHLKQDKDIENILVIGADKRGNESGYGRADAIIIVSLDKRNKQIKTTSLLADSYIDIPGYGKNTLGMAYSFGGAAVLYEAIAKNFGVSLDHYVILEFNSFVKMIDQIGGIDVEVSEKEAKYLQSHYQNTAAQVVNGANVLNGTQALAYVRIRQDVAGDFGRMSRERKVGKAVYQKLTGTSVSNLVEMAQKMMKDVTTDYRLKSMKADLATVVALSSGDVFEKVIPSDSEYTTSVEKGKTIYNIDIEQCQTNLMDYIYNPCVATTEETTQAQP